MQNCENCILQNNGFCQVFKQNITKLTEYKCPKYTDKVNSCNVCGQQYVQNKNILNVETEYFNICPNCAEKTGTCFTCENRNKCDFETNPSPIPKAVQKQIRNGNQIFVTTVKNEERIRQTCQVNCECFSNEFGCLKENGTCGKYKIAIGIAHNEDR